MSGYAMSQAPREPMTRIWVHGAPTVRRRDGCGTEFRPQAPISHEVSIWERSHRAEQSAAGGTVGAVRLQHPESGQ
jgi:hypothetical protein